MTLNEYIEGRYHNMRYVNAVAIVQLRLVRGFTIKDLAEYSGVSYQLLRKIELCEKKCAGIDVAIADLLAIANTLQCDLFSLLSEEIDLTAHIKIGAMIRLARCLKRYAVPPISTKGHQKAKVQRTATANKARAEQLQRCLDKYAKDAV